MTASIKVKLANSFVNPVSTITLKNVLAGSGGGASRLDQLLDVVPDGLTTVAGSTLVYDPVTDTYIVKLLDIDGGSF